MNLHLFSAARTAFAGALALMMAGTMTAGAATNANAQEKANNWIKQCTKNSKGTRICLTASNVYVSKPRRARLAGVAVRVEDGQPIKALLVVLPLGTFLTPGFTMRVDEGEAHKGVFTTCLQDGCHAQFQLTDAIYEEMRKGKKLHLIYITQRRKKFDVALPLDGFSKALDGQPTIPAEPKKK